MDKGVERKQKHHQECVMEQGLGTDDCTSTLHAGEESRWFSEGVSLL